MTPASPLPPDAILLHLGFHKTGTTALQSMFADSRPRLAEHDVLYPGRRRSHHPAAMAMTNRTWGVGREGGQDPDPRAWNRLARAARRHQGRVLISSENFALTADEAAARMVADLGADRVHVVFTVRPLAQLLSSSWQQYLKSGWTTTYDQWVEQVVAELEPGARRSGFWLRNDYPTIVGRWASLVGPQRVHLVCLDAADRGFLLRTFEELLGIPAGVVDPGVADSNRSMTAAEAELLRALNAASTHWDWPTYQHTIRVGAAAAMVEDRRPEPEETPLVTAQDVLDRVAEHGRGMARAVTDLGVVVHGDLDVIGEPVAALDGDPGYRPSTVPIDAAVASVLGAIRGAQKQAADELEETVAEAVGSAVAQALADAGIAADTTGVEPASDSASVPDRDDPASPRVGRLASAARRRLPSRRGRSLRPDE